MGKNFLRRLWNSLPVRWQIMMAIAVLSMLAGGIVGAAAIIDTAAVRKSKSRHLWNWRGGL